jgi:putative transposase
MPGLKPTAKRVWQASSRNHAGKRLFPPQEVSAVQEQIHQSPQTLGLIYARWSLRIIRQAFPFLAKYTLSGIWYFLQRHQITYKRGRLHLHSPDPDYLIKKQQRDQLLQLAQAKPNEHIVLFGDEFSYYRQPTQASDWSLINQTPRGILSRHSNTRHRVGGLLNVLTGQVHWRDGYKIGVTALIELLRDLRLFYPSVQIHIIWDCWPVHFHPDVIREATELNIGLVGLPTYSPWLNPIEKLWKKLKQDVLHLHRYSDKWEDLQQKVRSYLQGFAQGSKELLRYVGLLFFIFLLRKQLLKTYKRGRIGIGTNILDTLIRL